MCEINTRTYKGGGGGSPHPPDFVLSFSLAIKHDHVKF